MVEQVMAHLAPSPGRAFCDLTVGCGGHAFELLRRSSPDGRLVGLDADAEALDAARARLAEFPAARWTLIRSRFSGAAEALRGCPAQQFDGALVDLGVSSLQLGDPRRGFSFNADGPLDMRMDRSAGRSAADVVNGSGERELEEILRRYGQERHAGRIARAIAGAARRGRIESTLELAWIVRRAAGRARSGRIDAATRTFQALRIAVNDEMAEIEAACGAVFDLLAPGGIAVFLTYHSLEDGAVKRAFRRAAARGIARVVTPRPLVPTGEEVAANRRARSAHLRAARRSEQ